MRQRCSAGRTFQNRDRIGKCRNRVRGANRRNRDLLLRRRERNFGSPYRRLFGDYKLRALLDVVVLPVQLKREITASAVGIAVVRASNRPADDVVTVGSVQDRLTVSGRGIVPKDAKFAFQLVYVDGRVPCGLQRPLPTQQDPVGLHNDFLNGHLFHSAGRDTGEEKAVTGTQRQRGGKVLRLRFHPVLHAARGQRLSMKKRGKNAQLVPARIGGNGLQRFVLLGLLVGRRHALHLHTNGQVHSCVWFQGECQERSRRDTGTQVVVNQSCEPQDRVTQARRPQEAFVGNPLLIEGNDIGDDRPQIEESDGVVVIQPSAQ